MHISAKCYYGLRALYDLAVFADHPKVKSIDISHRQNISARFLESILAQLKQGGFVESRRGADGGYRLARPAQDITIGEVIRFIDGPFSLVKCLREPCTSEVDCGFYKLWRRADQALAAVLDGTKLSDLVEENRERLSRGAANWSI